MTVGLVAIHYPHDAHREELISRVKRAADVMRRTPGCLSAETWIDLANQTVVATGEWESDEALGRAFAAVESAGVDIEYDARGLRPREVLRLISV
jgi:quinol monooxygenase YgiN